MPPVVAENILLTIVSAPPSRQKEGNSVFMPIGPTGRAPLHCITTFLGRILILIPDERSTLMATEENSLTPAKTRT